MTFDGICMTVYMTPYRPTPKGHTVILSDTAIRNIKPNSDKALRLSDEKGLYLLVAATGGKLWRLDYRFNGKRKTLALGSYPEVSLKDARDKRDAARKQITQGIDPSENKKAMKAAQTAQADTFEVVAREWHNKFKSSWAEIHGKNIIAAMGNDLFPWLGDRPVADVEAPELLECVRRIESRGALDTAHRVKQIAGQVFRYAIATGRAGRDISQDLKGALPPAKTRHFPTVVDPKAIGELLRAIDGYKGHFVTRCALQFAPLVFVRPGELRKAEWKDIDLDNAEWRYRVTKTDVDHIVPLSIQALGDLQQRTYR